MEKIIDVRFSQSGGKVQDLRYEIGPKSFKILIYAAQSQPHLVKMGI